MSNIELVEIEKATGKAAELLSAVKQKLGVVPNIFRGFAQSPAVLEMYLKQSEALAGTQLSAQLREQIAVTVAGANQCDYCASAHSAIGKSLKLSAEELALNLKAESQDARSAAALKFASAVVRNQARVDESALREVRKAGFSDAEIVEIIAVVGVNIFTNYFNHIVDPEIDFPHVCTTGCTGNSCQAA